MFRCVFRVIKQMRREQVAFLDSKWWNEVEVFPVSFLESNVVHSRRERVNRIVNDGCFNRSVISKTIIYNYYSLICWEGVYFAFQLFEILWHWHHKVSFERILEDFINPDVRKTNTVREKWTRERDYCYAFRNFPWRFGYEMNGEANNESFGHACKSFYAWWDDNVETKWLVEGVLMKNKSQSSRRLKRR